MIGSVLLDAGVSQGPDWPWIAGGLVGAIVLVLGWLVLSIRGNFESHKTVTKESIEGVKAMVENDRRDVMRPLVDRMGKAESAIQSNERDREHHDEELRRVRESMVTKEYFSSEMRSQNNTLAGQNAMLADISRRLDGKVSVSSMPAVRSDGPYQVVDQRREPEETRPPHRPRAPSTRRGDGE